MRYFHSALATRLSFPTLVLFAVTTSGSLSQAAGPQNVSGPLELTKDTTWEVPDLVLTRNAVIQTHGHNLFIKVLNGLRVEEGAKIIRGADTPPPKPSPASAGTNGTSYTPGPTTDGQGVKMDGRSGQAGGVGGVGIVGEKGRAGDGVVLMITGPATGRLEIDESGSTGGEGGDGGAGGQGGSGEQGGRGEEAKALGFIPAGAASGPAHGGKGGDGGRGGDGGPGGPGGDAGRVVISVGSTSPGFSLSCNTQGGAGGKGGQPGKSGAGGAFGYGGRGSAGVSGREEERKGSPGSSPGPSKSGRDGDPGKSQEPQISGPIGDVSIVQPDGTKKKRDAAN